MVRYEYPLNEGIRTMLRLEQLFDRLGQLVTRESALDHHYAIATLFEIVDVASRADLKSDLLKELERHKGLLAAFRGNPGVSEAALNAVLGQIDHAFNELNTLPGKAGQALSANDFLMSIRSRISIPGGTCEFDLPAYFAWQQRDPARRRADLLQWIASVMPLAEALNVLLGLLRDSGAPQRVVARGGQFQQSLPQGRTFHLLRVRVDESLELVPEISGHRLIVSIRLMRPDAEGRLKPVSEDQAFELTLCA
ncbi:MAG TPA: cell division protein ZapD [Burkholderiaceae bacterium]|nr:cell division protein ZapD [Burkholderiaceae bacterium]